MKSPVVGGLFCAFGIMVFWYNQFCTKFGTIIVIPTFMLSRLFKKAPCSNGSGQKSRYNIFVVSVLETRNFAEVGITKWISPPVLFLYNYDTGQPESK